MTPLSILIVLAIAALTVFLLPRIIALAFVILMLVTAAFLYALYPVVLVIEWAYTGIRSLFRRL